LEFTPSYKICKLFCGGRKTGDRRVRLTPTSLQSKITLRIGDYGKKYARLNEGVFFYKSPTFTLALPNRPLKVNHSLLRWFWWYSSSMFSPIKLLLGADCDAGRMNVVPISYILYRNRYPTRRNRHPPC